ncbi:putative phosphonate metabolism protein [Roseovarius azorensis]|uniref:Putative phosphonate metabolism protein n=1 Tax=Roseovarius azorensis TaxID=1287727 RepID=A0A1H7UBF4_9RHOB|nr:putative phosphonate metabolism protein [Roseovarius azorensis]
MIFTRYAIYFTPPPGPLSDFGAAWLGWDPATGQPVYHLDLPGLPAPVQEITAAPRKYGLHATMAPPFRLADGKTGASLVDAFARFCTQNGPVTLDGLEVAALGRFLALIPTGDQGAVSALAARTVRAFDAFRAPLTEAQIARRRSGGLTPEQDALLLRWGYPYVMDAFRFHITLTGKRPKTELSLLRDALGATLNPLIPRPFAVDALSLMGEGETGHFHLIHRHTLTA